MMTERDRLDLQLCRFSPILAQVAVKNVQSCGHVNSEKNPVYMWTSKLSKISIIIKLCSVQFNPVYTWTVKKCVHFDDIL